MLFAFNQFKSSALSSGKKFASLRQLQNFRLYATAQSLNLDKLGIKSNVSVYRNLSYE
eukprot:Pgem_evm1s1455